jgi:pimeloyl-ACP methyl ester carboxylesterase
MAAVAWFGCDEGMLTGSSAQPAQVPGPATPGGQTPYPAPNDAGLGYYEYLPAGYETGAQFPLIVFFHGIGECGDGSLAELPLVLKNGPPKLIENGKSFPAIVISPQAPKDAQGNCSWVNITTPFVDYILSHYHVDRTRIYITGLSLGGQGTWAYAKSHASSVAAIVPICGFRSGTGYDVLRGMPIWTFHRIGDPTVSVNETASLLQEVTGVDPRPLTAGSTAYFPGTAWTWRTGEAAPHAGENPTFTVYTGSFHDAWTAAYNNQGMWDWLFQQHLPDGTTVFQQDFQSSTSVSSYVGNPPTDGQFNDLSSEATGGTWSINQGRLQLVRTGSTTTDNDAGITRWTDFSGAPAVLHVTFDLGVSGWTASPFQSGAMLLSVGAISGFSDYGNGDVAANTFHTISVKGQGTGQFAVLTTGGQSSLLATDGAPHHVALFLNKSGAAAGYRAPDGSLRTLQNNGAALWVDGAAVVADGAAANGSSSALADLRIRWTTADNGTWSLDNMFVERRFPQ